MRTFLVKKSFSAGERVRLGAEESSHALNSLRLGQGELVRLSNGAGIEGEGKIWKTEAGAEVEVLKIMAADKKTALHFLQAPLKGPKMDWLVEKLTELGVSRLQLIQTERTVATAEKIERWERLAEAALKQSGSPQLLRIQPVQPLAEALRSLPPSLKILLQPGAPESLAHLLAKASGIETLVLALGPEGGFSPSEENILVAAGFQPARLSSQILRGETAGIAAAAIAAHTLGI
jgi:16S rRNA (uracil1498-N3)-methyltransferase